MSRPGTQGDKEFRARGGSSTGVVTPCLKVWMLSMASAGLGALQQKGQPRGKLTLQASRRATVLLEGTPKRG